MKTRFFSIAIIFASFFLSLYRIISDSNEIILHWDFLGNVTKYGDRYAIIFLPIISIVLYVVLNYYKKNPFKMLRIKKIAHCDENFNLLSSYIQVITPIVLLVILYIAACSAQYISLIPWVIYFFIAFIIAYYIYVSNKLIKNRT